MLGLTNSKPIAFSDANMRIHNLTVALKHHNTQGPALTLGLIHCNLPMNSAFRGAETNSNNPGGTLWSRIPLGALFGAGTMDDRTLVGSLESLSQCDILKGQHAQELKQNYQVRHLLMLMKYLLVVNVVAGWKLDRGGFDCFANHLGRCSRKMGGTEASRDTSPRLTLIARWVVLNRAEGHIATKRHPEIDPKVTCRAPRCLNVWLYD